MPQVDLETLVSACAGGGSDRKIACETQAETKDDGSAENDGVEDAEPGTASAAGVDNPPESFWLSKDAEFDWFDRNAFYERKESTKGAITHSTSTGHVVHGGVSSTSTSQRFTLKSTSKGSIIGLPKTQKTSFIDVKRRNGVKPPNIRLLPKRPTFGKQTSTLAEPSSPKVSCMGKVRSKRRSRRASEPGKIRDKPVERSRSGRDREKRKPGLGTKFMAMFRSGKSRKKPDAVIGDVKDKSTLADSKRKSLSASKRARESPVVAEPAGDPPALGGMKRFASGRRSTEEFDGVVSGGSLDLRRGVGPS